MSHSASSSSDPAASASSLQLQNLGISLTSPSSHTSHRSSHEDLSSSQSTSRPNSSAALTATLSTYDPHTVHDQHYTPHYSNSNTARPISSSSSSLLPQTPVARSRLPSRQASSPMSPQHPQRYIWRSPFAKKTKKVQMVLYFISMCIYTCSYLSVLVNLMFSLVVLSCSDPSASSHVVPNGCSSYRRHDYSTLVFTL